MDKEFISACRQSDIALDNLLPIVFEWAQRKRLGLAELKQLDKLHNIWEPAPSGWLGQAQGVIVALSALYPASNRLSFIRSMGEKIFGKDATVLKLWKHYPWIFAPVRLVRHNEESLVTVEVLGEYCQGWPADEPWDLLEIWSPALGRMDIVPGQIILVTLWRGLTTWHTYGPIVPLSSMALPDLLYIAACAGILPQRKSPVLAKGFPGFTGSLVQRMSEKPLPFTMLFMWSDMKEIRSPAGAMLHCLAAYRIQKPQGMGNRNFWESLWIKKPPKFSWLTAKNLVYIAFKDLAPWENPAILVNLQESILFVTAISAPAMERGQELISTLDLAPIEQVIQVQQTSLWAAEKLFHFPTFFDNALQALNLTDTDVNKESDEVSNIEKIVNLLVEAHNKGLVPDIEKIAMECGVAPAMVEELLGQLGHVIVQGAGNNRNDIAPPEAMYQLCHPGLPHAPGYIRCLDAENLPAEVLETPIMVLWNGLMSLAALHGGLIASTGAGYIRPDIVQGIWKELAGTSAPHYPKTPPRKELDWPWLHTWRIMLVQFGYLRPDKEGFRLSPRAKDLVGNGRAAWRTFLELSLYHRPHESIHHMEIAPSFTSSINLMLYSLYKQEMKSSGTGKTLDELGEIWVSMQDSRIQKLPKEDQQNDFYPALQVSIILGSIGLGSFGLLLDSDLFSLVPSPLFTKVFVQ